MRTIERLILFVCGVSLATAILTIAPRQEKPETPRYRGLDANLFMQTAAEYRACCLQAFQWSTARVEQRLQSLPEGRLPPAVVLDLDETVLDNGGFQADQIRAGRAYDYALWEVWEREGGDRVRLVPGARNFIHELQRLGVTPIYITNRNERYLEQTIFTLKRLGIDTEAASVLCANEQTGSNKTSRRQAVQQRYEVLLWVGDNLRDFDETFRFKDPAAGSNFAPSALEERHRQVDANSSHWGNDWIILPNPAYGEWNKPLNRGERDIEWLLPPAAGG